jgi:hypothetical protein
VCQWLYGDALWIDETDRVTKPQRELDFDQGIFFWGYNYIPQPATFWRRALWRSVGQLDTARLCAMDYDLWMRFVAAGARPRHLRHYLAAFRCHKGQKNQQLRAVSDREDHAIREAAVGRSITRPEAIVKHAWHRSRRVTRRVLNGAYVERLAGRVRGQDLVDRAVAEDIPTEESRRTIAA